MRRLTWMAGLLALVVLAAGCGGEERQKLNPPAGDGATQDPDVDIDSVDALRSTMVDIKDGKFTSAERISIKQGNKVQFVNRDSRAYTLVGENKAGTASFKPVRLAPGESFERPFLQEGDVKVSLKGKPPGEVTIGIFY